MRKCWTVAAMLAATTMTGAPVRAADDLAQRFGAREEATGMRMSPDGKRIAYLRPVRGAETALFVAALDGTSEPVPILKTAGKHDSLGRCNWSTATRLVCSVYVINKEGDLRLGQSRLISLDADGGGMKTLTARNGTGAAGGGVIDWSGGGAEGSVLMTRFFAAEFTTGTILGRSLGGLGVERVDTTTLERQTVEPPRGASEYIADGHGTVRIMGLRTSNDAGRMKNVTRYWYRKAGDKAWLDLSSVVDAPSGGSTGFDPYAVDRDLNVAYGFDSDGAGRSALYRVSLDGSLKRERVLARGDVDVDGLLRIGRQQRVVGASFATDRRTAVFFDAKLAALAASLAKALPAGSTIDFVDASADETRLLLFVGSDVDPGRYYLFDRTTRKLGEILPVRPQLAAVPLATVKAITYAAADGTPIPAYLTLPAGSDGKGLPAIVMPHGGPSARDEWGFDYLAQFFAAKGYAVLQPNYRGSAGYGSGWFQKNGFQSWKTAIGDIDDGGRHLLQAGIAAPGKLAIVGWSYGGYAALQSSVLDPDLFKAVIAVAPVADLAALRDESKAFDSYDMVDAFIGRGAHVTEGSPAQNVGRIKAPVLMFHGDYDQNVGVGQSRMMAARLKAAGRSVDYVEFPGLDHQLEDDTARATLLARSDAFLRKALGL